MRPHIARGEMLIKCWLERQYKAKFDDSTIRKGAEALTEL